MTAEARIRLRSLIADGTTLVVPGAPNALTARLVEECEFEVVYVSGAGIANTFLGSPDIGLVSLPEVVAHTAAIRNAVELPLIVDADTGFGNAVNVWHTVRALERAGASAIQIEDQTFPKRCGHFSDKSVIPSSAMVQKIRAACDARSDPNTMIIARTDSLESLGVDAACARVNAFLDAGADMGFVEGPRTEEEIIEIARLVQGPKVLNLVEGGRTPALATARIQELGFNIALYANLPLLAAIEGITNILQYLRGSTSEPGRPAISTWDVRQTLVRKPYFDELQARYADPDDTDASGETSEHP